MAAPNIGTLKTKKDIIHDFPTITAKCLKLRVQVERLQLRDFTSTSLLQIQQEITELQGPQRIDNIPYLNALVDSMPRRLEDVIRRDDNTTKY